MTDDQFERIKNGLNFHSEGGVYNLCTLTETTLRTTIEDAVKFYEKQQKIDAEQIRALQKQNGELTDELAKKADTNHQLVEQMAKLSEENAELKKWQKDTIKARGNDYMDWSRMKAQLTKAKELLKQWVELSKPKLEGYPIPPIQEQTEQFISEVEK